MYKYLFKQHSDDSVSNPWLDSSSQTMGLSLQAFSPMKEIIDENNPWVTDNGLDCIQKIFNSCGLSYMFVWQNQGQNGNTKLISSVIRQKLQDQFI